MSPKKRKMFMAKTFFLEWVYQQTLNVCIDLEDETVDVSLTEKLIVNAGRPSSIASLGTLQVQTC